MLILVAAVLAPYPGSKGAAGHLAGDGLVGRFRAVNPCVDEPMTVFSPPGCDIRGLGFVAMVMVWFKQIPRLASCC